MVFAAIQIGWKHVFDATVPPVLQVRAAIFHSLQPTDQCQFEVSKHGEDLLKALKATAWLSMQSA